MISSLKRSNEMVSLVPLKDNSGFNTTWVLFVWFSFRSSFPQSLKRQKTSDDETTSQVVNKPAVYLHIAKETELSFNVTYFLLTRAGSKDSKGYQIWREWPFDLVRRAERPGGGVF